MNKIKASFLLVPEYFIVLSIIYYWYLTAIWYNFIAAGLLCLFVLQLLRPRRMLGFYISFVFLILNLYMVLALVSELGKSPSSEEGTTRLLVFGCTYLGLNILMSVLMLIRHCGVQAGNVKQRHE